MYKSYPPKPSPLPKTNEKVICRFIKQTEYGILLNLLEYDLEVSLITENSKELKRKKIFVCLVKSINEQSVIELTEDVSVEESKECLNVFTENKYGHNILISLSKKTNTPLKLIYEDFAWQKIKEYGTLKSFLNELLKGCDFESPFKSELINLWKQKMQNYKVKIKATAIIKSPSGIQYLRNCLELILQENKDIEIHFIRSPNYEFSLKGESKEEVHEELKRILKEGAKHMLKFGGEFDIISMDGVS